MSAERASLVAQHPAVAPGLGSNVDAQRARLLEAVTRVVADRGYAAATVTDIVRAAGVSRSTFYDLFEGKEACFLDAYRHGVVVLLERVREAVHDAAAGGWRGQLRAGVRAYLRTVGADPAFARAFVLELSVAGPAALDAHQEAMRQFAERYRATFEQARAERPSLREPHADALIVLCAGTEHLVAERLRTGRAGELGELEDVFCDCAESVLLGPARDPDHPTGG